MSRSASLLTLLLLAGLGAGGYLGYRQHQAQEELVKLLQQLDETLTAQNDEAAKQAREALRGIEETIAKNRNQPTELAVLHRAQALSSRVQTLCDTLRSVQQRLRRAAGGSATPGPLRQPEATAAVAQLLGSGTQGQRALHQQLAACAATLRRLGPAVPAQLTEPPFAGLPAVECLAALTQLEAQVRASEARTLRHLSRPLGASRLPTRFVAAATAERATVAPGDTYRARLLVVKSLSTVATRMYCNGHPVPISPDGVGLVRFRAPTKLGPASWTAAIRLNQNGRDTTFVVRVPYRVARR
ncbi:MAG: hypothetical protein ACRYF0_13025 [Janthinobacterium lividum]